MAGDERGEESTLARALEINPNYAEALFYRGTLVYARGEREQAMKDLERAVSLERALGGEPFEAAFEANRKGDFEGALMLLRAIAGAERDPANLHAKRAEILLREKKLPDALQEYEEALNIAPRYADVRCRFGQALLEAGRLEEAVGQLQMALDVNPKYVEAHAQLGIALRRLGREREARAAFKKAAQLDPLHLIASQEIARMP